ncbi:SRPBCC family protein [Actinoplanes oblitus]|uniref:SRPBCC family protein n=1 Tax=Actinoplanes oblitus TaxID=3040509 RepID=A0ABY8WB42_9ACTN|nr:SRPBCC family protein [Actinoplanes oblitus]WIM95094.1 SRPBCC family protein [Actinoplanes oblitus]
MATVRVETFVDVKAADAWEAIADVEAVHERMLPGRVSSAEVDGDIRTLTMPDGARIRERIVAIDHELRRLAYSVIDGSAMPLTYHHATFEVVEVDGRTHIRWTTDLLPDALAPAVRARVERGIVELKAVLEAAA